MKHFKILGMVWCLAFMLGCDKKEQSFEFKERLSEYGYFQGNLADLNPTEGILPYDLSTPLFSDYAQKARFIYVPEGVQIMAVGQQMEYPVGTVLLKNFFYNNDERDIALGRRIIETRMLVKFPDAWKTANYIWNENQTEATRDLLGGTTQVSWVNEEGVLENVDYVIPDQNDCKGCHRNEGKIVPIGPRFVRNLNNSIAYEEGTKNQIEKWHEQGWLSEEILDSNSESLPAWDDASITIDARARAYLDMNCAHCHSEGGTANNTGLFLSYEQDDPFRLGVNKSPVSAAQGSGKLMYNIVPGNAEESIIAYRMKSVEAGVLMPELGRTLVHDEGVALINQWIDNMPVGGQPMP